MRSVRPKPGRRASFSTLDPEGVGFVGVEDRGADAGAVVVREAVVEARVVLVVIVFLRADGQEVITVAWSIGQRDFGQQRDGCGIERQVDGVAGEWRTGERIYDCGQAGEIAGAFRLGGNAEDVRERIAEPLAVVIGEEECFLFCDRAAERGAELVFAKRRGLADGCEKVAGVDGVVAQEFVKVAVKAVAPGAGHNVDDARGFAAELRTVIRLVDFKFLHVVGGGIQDDVVVVFVGNAGAIDHEQVVAGALAENIDELAGLLEGIAARAAGRIDDAFAEEREFEELVVFQRKREHLRVLDEVADFGRFGFEQAHDGFYGDHLGNFADLKDVVLPDVVSRVQGEVFKQ